MGKLKWKFSEIGTRGMVNLYQQLFIQGKIQPDGAGVKRLKELQVRLELEKLMR